MIRSELQLGTSGNEYAPCARQQETKLPTKGFVPTEPSIFLLQALHGIKPSLEKGNNTDMAIAHNQTEKHKPKKRKKPTHKRRQSPQPGLESLGEAAETNKGNKPCQRDGKPALKSVQRKHPPVQSSNGPGIKPKRNHKNHRIPAVKNVHHNQKSIDNGRHPASVRPTRKAAFAVRTSTNLQSKST